ncbi:MAG: hypothetical protein CMI13_12410 [Oleibacter sp.]|nr:hypothetical protein [Thalassolituus sp.]
MASILICDSPVVSAEGFVSCNAWQTADYESLISESEFSDWESLIGFDTEIFGIVTAALLLSFVSGHVLGVIVRVLNRT